MQDWLEGGIEPRTPLVIIGGGGGKKKKFFLNCL